MNNQFRRWGESAAPCNGCTLRSSGCHGDCPKDKSSEYNYYGYKAFKEQSDTERAKRKAFLREKDEVMSVYRGGKRKGGQR